MVALQCCCCTQPLAVESEDIVVDPKPKRGCSLNQRDCSLDGLRSLLRLKKPALKDADKTKKLRFQGRRAPRSPPAFAGRWLLAECKGDMEAFMIEVGTPWLLVNMAKSFNFGIGKVLQDVSLNGNKLQIITEGTPKGVNTMNVTINDGLQETVGLDGNPVFVGFSWETDAMLFMEGELSDGKVIPTTRRYIQDGDTVLETTAPSGTTVKRIFTRQSS